MQVFLMQIFKGASSPEHNQKKSVLRLCRCKRCEIRHYRIFAPVVTYFGSVVRPIVATVNGFLFCSGRFIFNLQPLNCIRSPQQFAANVLPQR
jgi:hypothetical protein